MVQKRSRSHSVPVPAWFLVPEFLNQKARYSLLNPSFVQGPTMTLLTLLSTHNRVWPLSLLHPLPRTWPTHILCSHSLLFRQTQLRHSYCTFYTFCLGDLFFAPNIYLNAHTYFIDTDEVHCPRSHSINLNQDTNQVSSNSVVPASLWL